MEGYFHKLFSLANEVSRPSLPPLGTPDEPEEAPPHSIEAFIRPDMACNIYSLVDFWLPQLSDHHARKRSLPLTYFAGGGFPRSLRSLGAGERWR